MARRFQGNGDDRKELIVSTIEDLLKEKDLGHISISEICERAEIPRQSFYYHFGNMLEVITWAVRSRMKGFSITGRKVTNQTLMEGIMDLCQALSVRKTIVKGFMESAYANELLSKTIRSLKVQSKSFVITNFGEGLEDKTVDFASSLVAYTAAGAVWDWAFEGMQYPAENMRTMMDEIVANLFRADLCEKMGVKPVLHD